MLHHHVSLSQTVLERTWLLTTKCSLVTESFTLVLVEFAKKKILVRIVIKHCQVLLNSLVLMMFITVNKTLGCREQYMVENLKIL